MLNENETPQAPDFSAPDSEGKVFHLADRQGKHKVVLVFNRGFF
jgi:peroxiredoxin